VGSLPLNAATVSSPSTVGVYDDLASGQAAIAVRAANHEVPGWVDVVNNFLRDHLWRQAWLDDLLDDVVPDFFLGYGRSVLC